MGTAYPFEKEKLICGCLTTDLGRIPEIRSRLEEAFGPVDYQAEPYVFSEISPYYDREMDGQVLRVFFSFRELVDPSRLAEIKILTNRMEESFARPDGRNVNLDPGTMGPGKLILATTKPAAHRIALHSGIFAEITLFYARGDFQVLPWTYLDFREASVRAQLRAIRALYMNQRKKKETSPEDAAL